MDYTTNRILKVFGKRNEGPAAIDGVKAVLVFPSLLTPVCPGSGQLRLTALSWGVGGMGQDRAGSKLLTGFLRPEWGVGEALPSTESHTAPLQLAFVLFHVVIGIIGFHFLVQGLLQPRLRVKTVVHG